MNPHISSTALSEGLSQRHGKPDKKLLQIREEDLDPSSNERLPEAHPNIGDDWCSRRYWNMVIPSS